MRKKTKEKRFGSFGVRSAAHFDSPKEKAQAIFLANPIILLKIQLKILKIKLFAGFLHLTSLVFGGARDKRNFLRSISIVL